MASSLKHDQLNEATSQHCQQRPKAYQTTQQTVGAQVRWLITGTLCIWNASDLTSSHCAREHESPVNPIWYLPTLEAISATLGHLTWHQTRVLRKLNQVINIKKWQETRKFSITSWFLSAQPTANRLSSLTFHHLHSSYSGKSDMARPMNWPILRILFPQ